MTRPTPRATTAGVAAAHARIAGRRHRALVSTALRTRSRHAREVLAEVAWPGRTPAELDAWAVTRTSAGLPDGADPLGVADYARVLAVQLGAAQDVAVARALLEAVQAGPGWTGVRREHVELLAHLRVLGGDPAGAVALAGDRRVRADVAAAVRADALHPAIDPAADPAAWAHSFGEALHGSGLAPFLPPQPGESPSLDRLRVEPRPQMERPERVTVLMSAYRPGPALLTAVGSVLAQTWTHLELLVIDDASGPGPDGAWADLLDRVGALDPRVRVIRKAVNGGTYRARNTALRLATGDLAIVIDSDDWWHPQTLELCAAPLLAERGLLATRAEGVRVTPDLLLTRPGYRPRFASAATVLFRRSEVMGRIGFFDPTRKGADTEFTRRLEAACGPVVKDLGETTTLLRGGEQTLSSDEFGNGWRHPARHQYKSLYTPWHERITQDGDSAYLDPEQPRRFPEPIRWERPTHPLLDHDRRVDLCLAGDWRRHGGPQRSMMEEIRAAREVGLRVGVMHLEALRFMGNKDVLITPELVELLQGGEVLWVHPDDDVDIDVLMVRYPPILQYPPTLPRHVRAREVLVVANQAPLEADGSDQRYVVADVTERTRELFGAPVRWVPQSPRIRQILLDQDPDVPLVDWDNPGLIDIDTWSVRPDRAPGADGRPVVVGRHSRDDRIKFPGTWEELVRGYDFGAGYEVRMLGAVETVERLRAAAGEGARVPDGWRLLPHGEQDVRDFLAGLDFFLYLDNPDAHEAFGRTLLEAAASGVLTIAHPKHRTTFGDALDYADPGQAQDLVAAYVADPAAYADRVARTRAAVAERYSRASFVRRLSGRGAEAAPEPGAVVDAATAADSGPGGTGPLQLVPGSPDPTGPTLVGEDRVEAEGLVTVRILLRSAADGTRADSLTLVHDGLPDVELRAWLRPAVAGWSDPRWSMTPLLTSAPDGVRAVVLRREGLARAVGRGRWRVAGADPDVRPGGEIPEGWGLTAWWDRRPPAALVLEPVRAARGVPGAG